MKILALTDLFVTQDLLERVFRSRFPDKSPDLSFIHLASDWPRTPLQHGEEVTEFVGDVEAIAAAASEAEVIVTHVGPVTKSVIENAPHLQAIAVPRGGPVNVNVQAASDRGVAVLNAPGRNAPVVAEFTVGLILSELRNIARAHKDLSAGIWRGYFYEYAKAGFELSSATIGLIGFGSIGARVTKLLKPFGCRILVNDPYVDDERIRDAGCIAASRDDLLAEADIVTLQLRLTEQTRRYVDAEFFARMKPGAFFVNTARGGLVDYAALMDALQSGQVGRAALDVFDPEPLPSESKLHELYLMDNVTVTPHIGGASRETARRGLEIVADDLARLHSGKEPLHCLNLAKVRAPR